MVFHWSLSDSKSPQVSRTLLSILAVLNTAVIWMVPTRLPTSKSSSPFNSPLVTVPNAPITIGIIVTIMFHNFFQFPSKVEVLILLFTFFRYYYYYYSLGQHCIQQHKFRSRCWCYGSRDCTSLSITERIQLISIRTETDTGSTVSRFIRASFQLQDTFLSVTTIGYVFFGGAGIISNSNWIYWENLNNSISSFILRWTSYFFKLCVGKKFFSLRNLSHDNTYDDVKRSEFNLIKVVCWNGK